MLESALLPFGGALGWSMETMDANHNVTNWIGARASPTTSGWTLQSNTYTIPSGVAYVALYATNWKPTSPAVIRVDDGFLIDNRSSLQITQSLDYLPFGELNSSDSAVTSHKFTGLERDGETGLDHTLFRKYSSTLGRWTTPDPASLSVASPAFPQSWNRYAYVLNNPLVYRDPQGLFCVYLDDSGEKIEALDDNSDSGECGSNGGYRIPGEYGGASQISIDPDLGIVSGYGYLDGSWQYSVAGAMDSNTWGAWTQTADAPQQGSFGGNSSWTGTFVKTFVNGVLHGDRQPGESFGACVDRNIRETTFGTVDPQKLAQTIPATAVGVAGALMGKVPFNIPFDPGAGGISAFTASAYGLGRALGVGGVAMGGLVGAANGVGRGLAIAGAAIGGLYAGSAINCR